MKRIINLIVVITMCLAVTAVTAACVFGEEGPPKNNGNNNTGGDNTGGDNNEGGDNEDEEEETDPALLALISELLEIIRGIEDGGDYFDALNRILTHLSPEVIKDSLGQLIDEETAALIDEYYDSAVTYSAYLALLLPNIDMLADILDIIEPYIGQEIPDYVQIITGISKEPEENIYYYKTYTFTIISVADKIYNLKDSKTQSDYTFKLLGEDRFLIEDDTSGASYDITYDKESFWTFCSVYDGEGVTLYTVETIKQGDIPALQYHDKENSRLIQFKIVLIEESAQTEPKFDAVMSIQENVTDEPQSIKNGLPSDFAKNGVCFTLDKILESLNDD